MNLFFFALILQIMSSIVVLFFTDQRKASLYSHLCLISGLVLGFVPTISALLFSDLPLPRSFFWGIPRQLFRFDSLSLYFLGVIQLASIPITIYSYSYLKHYLKEGRSVRGLFIFYSMLLVSTQLVVIANHAILFLIFWELMSTFAYLGMIFEKEKKDVQTGSFYYLIVSHIVIFTLYIFFFLLHHQVGSWLLSDFHLMSDSGNLFLLLYLLAFVAFFLKAGFIPFHFWLPRAHPIAPTIFSAFLSGVVLKTGIYGILRTFQFLKPTPEWLGWFLLIFGMIASILGIWYALAQKDIKQLLAYSSVENIGIIGIGIGIGFIGSSYNSIPIQILGFGGALLHTLNHALFKSLLFIGSGILYQNLGTRNIELMGGIIHRGKYFAILFLIGSLSISGLPPFNGFISEFIIYNGFFTAAKELKNYYPLLMLIAAVGLAFVGGLSAVCFTKINSVIFLGSERKKIKDFHLSFYDHLSLGIFAFLCIAIGFYPQPFIKIVDKVLFNGFVIANPSLELVNINWLFINLISIIMLAGILIVYLWKKYINNKYGGRLSSAWGCGYESINSRMQYTSSSFTDELNKVSRSVLSCHKEIVSPKGIFPIKGYLKSYSEDLIDSKILLPFFRKFSLLISQINFLSYTDIRYSIASILIIILIYSIIGFLWI